MSAGSLDIPYRVVAAEPEHVRALPAVERAAAQRFAGDDLNPDLAARTTPIDVLASAQADGRLWVALAADESIGFAFVRTVDGLGHLEEMNVHPDHGRRRLGSHLLDAALQWSRSCGFRGLTLATFDHIPWNRPFYERRGFSRLETAQCGAELLRILAAEWDRGLRGRVAMARFEVGRGGQGAL
jgi:GNAT superfamily N-acetyltransferase